MSQIIIVGSLNADLVQALPRVPQPGETLLAADIQVVPGGKGANQAVAAGRLAGNATMIGEVGQDNFADLLIDSLGASGVDHSRVGHSSGSTGTAIILVLPGGENLIVVSPAANAKLTPEMVTARLGAVSSDTILLCQLEVPMASTACALATAHASGAITILDPAPAQPLDSSLLANVTYLTPNQTEAALLLGSSAPIETYEDAERAAHELLALGPANVIVKLGALGCVIANSNSTERVPGFQVMPVDTTAAGDTFNAAFAVGLSEGLSPASAARFAHAAAAISVTRFGAQSSIPSRAEVDAFLESHQETPCL
jgi:ribokinase